jgi:hypothetical protein
LKRLTNADEPKQWGVLKKIPFAKRAGYNVSSADWTMTKNPKTDLRDWPAARINPRAHRVIRHAYEEVLTACARLISFSTGAPSVGGCSINSRQEMLAVEDLISFAMHARRIIEVTGLKSRFNKIEIELIGAKRPPRIRVLKAINCILHNNTIEIIREVWAREVLFKNIIELMSSEISIGYCEPLAIVNSKEGSIAFLIRELIEIFEQQILSPIIDLCSEQRLFLEDLDFS